MSKPIAVLISDIHFNINNLDVASAALIQAREKAKELRVPLVIAGDLNDTKAIIRAEVANRLITILHDHGFNTPDYNFTRLLIGNHDLINERGEEHALHFLDSYCGVVKSPVYDTDINSWLVPYQNSVEKMQEVLSKIPKGSRIILHQGVTGSDMGHYVQDKTALPKEAFADFRCISGHYHKAQDIKCGRPRKGAVGLFTYIGSPYTTSFSEANDGPKGFRVLMDDGLLESVPTNLRAHRIFERTAKEMLNMIARNDVASELGLRALDGDNIIWFKVAGSDLDLAQVKKSDIATHVVGHGNFKLDKIPTDSKPASQQSSKKVSEGEMLDNIIDRTDESNDNKKQLKRLWRELEHENSSR